jgi:Nif-specific regulatory protein
MGSELIIVSGSAAGARIPLGADTVRVGRAPDSTISLEDPDCGWRHCEIRMDAGAHLLVDSRSAAGTIVNGVRAVTHRLEHGDQISIGSHVLVYEDSRQTGASPANTRDTLLRACSVQFLIRALVSAQGPARERLIEPPLLRVLADLLPLDSGSILLGHGKDEIRGAALEREAQFPRLAEIAARTCEEGSFEDPATGVVAVPLWVRGAVRGVVALKLRAGETPRIGEHRDTLAALASLAAVALESEQDVQALQVAKADLEERLGAAPGGIIGQSAAIRRVLQVAQRVAPQDTTVLILGESGTGKELIARAIHERSSRESRPFLAINCAALTETLLESELFGHEKGAFTGATVQKKGKLEVADGGTVFLDELGEMPPALQSKLLRVLQQREFERVGGTRTLSLDVRLLAATNRDLLVEVRKGAFREDLYHRLNVVAIRMPALRERCEDIPLLARYFLGRSAAKCGRRVSGIAPEAERLLLRYEWPGNVRELENAIERAVVLGDGDTLLPEDLPETVLDASPRAELDSAYQHSVGDAKRDAITRAWTQANGDYKAAADLLGVHPNSLLRMVRNLGLRDVLKAAAGRR